MENKKEVFTREQQTILAEEIYRRVAALNVVLKDGQEAGMEIHIGATRDAVTKKLIIDCCCHDIKVHTFQDPTKPEDQKADDHGFPRPE